MLKGGEGEGCQGGRGGREWLMHEKAAGRERENRQKATTTPNECSIASRRWGGQLRRIQRMQSNIVPVSAAKLLRTELRG